MWDHFAQSRLSIRALFVSVGVLILAVPGHAAAVGMGGTAGSQNNGDYTSSGGSVGGSVTWYELQNVPHERLDNPPNFGDTGKGGSRNDRKINKERELGLSPRQRAELERIRNRTAGNDWETSVAATRVLMRPCGGDSYARDPKCPLWSTTRHKSSGSSAGTWYEVHRPAPWGGPDLTANVAIGYQIKIWRENRSDNDFDLIFERRIGLRGGDTDPHSGSAADQNIAWWYGGYRKPAGEDYNRDGQRWTRGGSFSVNRAVSAGPLGQFSSKDRQNCLSNWRHSANGTRQSERNRQGKTHLAESDVRPSRSKDMSGACYWEGADIGHTYFRWGPKSGYTDRFLKQSGWGPRPQNLPDDQFGDDRARDQGLLGKGLKEAIFLKWKLPLNDPQGTTKINYKIEGAPGLYYAVQIVALDKVENTMPIKAKGPFVWPRVAGSKQYFRAFIVNPVACVKSCGPPGSPGDPPSPDQISESEPEAELSLEAQTVAEVREHTEQTVALEATDSLRRFQALFPGSSDLIHYTPQMQFSSPQINTGYGAYGANYVVYDAEAGEMSLPRQPASWAPPTPAGQRPFLPQMTSLPQAMKLDSAAVASTNLHSESYGMTWLQPTLDNPCLGNLPPAEQIELPWPGTPDQCRSDARGLPEVFNAWDDMLLAQADWEARWVGGVKDEKVEWDEIGRVAECVSPARQRVLTRQGWDRQMTEADMCSDGSGYRHGELLRCPDANAQPGLSSLNSGECKHGYVPLSTNAINRTSGQHAQGYVYAADGDDAAAVRISLRTNRPGRVVSGALIPRGAGQAPLRNLAQTGLHNSRSGEIELNYCEMGMWNGVRVQLRGGGEVEINNKESNPRRSWLGDGGCSGYALKWQWTENDASCNANGSGSKPRRSSFPAPNEISTGFGRYHDPGYGSARRAYNPDQFVGAPYFGERPGVDAQGNGEVMACREQVKGKTKRGYYSRGKWVVPGRGRPAPGWGVNNSGGPIEAGGYIADFSFAWPTDSAAVTELSTTRQADPTGAPRFTCPKGAGGSVVGTCWRMEGYYDGYHNLQWVYANRSDVTDGAFVKVFSPRSSR